MPFSRAPRTAATTVPCHRCRSPLTAKRDCAHVSLHCASCKKDFDLREYVQEMDPALESFLEAVNVDRV